MTRFCKSCYLIFGSWFLKLKIWPGFPQVSLPLLDAEPEHFIMQGVAWLSVALIKHWTCTNLTIMMRFASGFNVNLGQEFSQKSVARAFSRHRWIYRVSQKRWLIEKKNHNPTLSTVRQNFTMNVIWEDEKSISRHKWCQLLVIAAPIAFWKCVFGTPCIQMW